MLSCQFLLGCICSFLVGFDKFFFQIQLSLDSFFFELEFVRCVGDSQVTSLMKLLLYINVKLSNNHWKPTIYINLFCHLKHGNHGKTLYINVKYQITIENQWSI
jgi:hypothetical protein